MFADKAITRKAVEEVQQTLRAAEAAHREAIAEIASCASDPRRKIGCHRQDPCRPGLGVRPLRGRQGRSWERTDTLLQYTIIRAHLFDGLIAQRGVDTGHLVPVGHAAEKPLFVVVRADLLRIFVDVPEGDAATVAAGSESAGGEPGPRGYRLPCQSRPHRMGAEHRHAAPCGPRSTFRNADGRLRPGMYAYADLKVAERRDVLSLPKTALPTQDGKPCCLCIEASGQGRFARPLSRDSRPATRWRSRPVCRATKT